MFTSSESEEEVDAILTPTEAELDFNSRYTFFVDSSSSDEEDIASDASIDLYRHARAGAAELAVVRRILSRQCVCDNPSLICYHRWQSEAAQMDSDQEF